MDRFSSTNRETEWSSRRMEEQQNSGNGESWKTIQPPQDSWRSNTMNHGESWLPKPSSSSNYKYGRPLDTLDDEFLIGMGAKRLSNGDLIDKSGTLIRIRDSGFKTTEQTRKRNAESESKDSTDSRDGKRRKKRMESLDNLPLDEKARIHMEMVKRMSQKQEDEYEEIISEQEKDVSQSPPVDNSPITPEEQKHDKREMKRGILEAERPSRPKYRELSWRVAHQKQVEELKAQVYGTYGDSRNPDFASRHGSPHSFYRDYPGHGYPDYHGPRSFNYPAEYNRGPPPGPGYWGPPGPGYGGPSYHGPPGPGYHGFPGYHGPPGPGFYGPPGSGYYGPPPDYRNAPRPEYWGQPGPDYHNSNGPEFWGIRKSEEPRGSPKFEDSREYFAYDRRPVSTDLRKVVQSPTRSTSSRSEHRAPSGPAAADFDYQRYGEPRQELKKKPSDRFFFADVVDSDIPKKPALLGKPPEPVRNVAPARGKIYNGPVGPIQKAVYNGPTMPKYESNAMNQEKEEPVSDSDSEEDDDILRLREVMRTH